MKPNKKTNAPRAHVRRLVRARRAMMRRISPAMRALEADIIARVEHEFDTRADSLTDAEAIDRLKGEKK